uniref:Progonadoliberin n=1 Tax=Ficedula albicollis TaxID=59894 RepID=A0A803VK47_FICAL
MAPRGSLLLLALLLLSCALPRGHGQHWSHGWYPGGKRDLRTPANLQPPAPGILIPLGYPHPVSLSQITLSGLFPRPAIISPPSSWIYPCPRLNPTPVL